jgi:hypothetical protein
MTTTDQFQKLPTYYKSQDECNESIRPNTNPRYSNFTQFCFTAGDIDQFETYRNPVNGDGSRLDVSVDADNKWVSSMSHEHVDWKKYKNMTTESVDNTFRYIFDKFKKGLFIKIKDNKLSVFLPFSKHNFTNEWSSFLKQPPSFKTMTDFLIHASRIQGYNIPASKVNKHVNTWYANNCLVRTEYPVGENDRGLPNIKDMLETLCQTRNVPDIEVFINRRDFPLLKTDNTESYEHIFGMERYPLLSHRYDSYAPLLSMVTTDLHADIPMPTAEDWARVCSQEPDHSNRKYFAPDCRSYDYSFSTPWEQRVPTAVFRGASTGCGTTIETNPRLLLSYMSDRSPVEKVGDQMIRLLDAGITKLNLRPRKMMSSPFLSLIDPSSIKKVEPLTPLEQSRYKYIVHVDGHVSAFRLSLELSMGSVLLIAESKYRLWFRRHLIPYEHYVPIQSDLSDLFDKIRWCRTNDEKCKEIASNAKKFYERYLQKDGILDYMQSLFVSIKNTTGQYFYNTIAVSSIIKEWQLSKLVEIQGDSSKQYTNNSISYHFKDRNYYAMEGLQMVMRDAGGFREYNSKLIHESHDNTRVVESEFVNSNSSHKLVMKTTSRTNEWVNESFCGISEINKLIKEIPNFRYTYYADLEKNVMISEYIKGVTFKKFIEDGCDMKTFVFILTVISMALAVAQERCGFVHYDLYPWNIIILTLNEPKKVTYRFQKNVMHVTSHIVPVIIDYGKTHVISEKIHTGTIEPFKTSIFQDCFCLVVSSIYEMTQRKTNEIRPWVVNEGSDVSKLLYITNFFAVNEPFRTYDDMMVFISTHKKYNEMIYGNYGKCKLEKKGPVDFFFFMTDKFEDLQSNIEQPDVRPDLGFIIQKPSFYYDIITGSKTIVKDITSYLEHIEKTCIQNVFNDDMKEENELTYAYGLSMISLTIDGVIAFNVDFLNNDESLMKKCEDLKKNMLQKFKSLPQPSYLPSIPYYSTNDSMCLAKYNVKTFSVPQQILTLLQGTITDKNETLLSFRDMFSFISFYNVPYQISRDFYMKYQKILDINPVVMLNYNANLYTLRMISGKLYNDDITYLSSLPKPPIHLLQTLEYIQNIL